MAIYKPGGTRTIYLTDDENGPGLLVTELSFGQVCEFEDQVMAIEARTNRELESKFRELIGPLIHGWVNVEGEYSWDALIATLTADSFAALPYRIMYRLRVAEKKS